MFRSCNVLRPKGLSPLTRLHYENGTDLFMVFIFFLDVIIQTLILLGFRRPPLSFLPRVRVLPKEKDFSCQNSGR